MEIYLPHFLCDEKILSSHTILTLSKALQCFIFLIFLQRDKTQS